MQANTHPLYRLPLPRVWSSYSVASLYYVSYYYITYILLTHYIGFLYGECGAVPSLGSELELALVDGFQRAELHRLHERRFLPAKLHLLRHEGFAKLIADVEFLGDRSQTVHLGDRPGEIN